MKREQEKTRLCGTKRRYSKRVERRCLGMKKKLLADIKKNQKRYRKIIFLLSVGFLVLYTGYLVVTQAVNLHNISVEQEAVTKKIEEERIMKQKLEEEYKQLHDMTYIEQIARDELGLVKEGEVPFISRAKKTN